MTRKAHNARNGEALIPAVGYIRMSSDMQDKSPEQQRAEIIKLADAYGCKIIRWYEDHAISGVENLKRKQFQQLLRDAQQKKDFRIILCWDQDRFARLDSISAGEVLAPLIRAGVSMITCAQGQLDWSTFAGRIVYSVTQEGKHQFLVDLSRNVLRGKIRGVQRTGIAGRLNYGYDREYYDEAGKLVHRATFLSRFRAPRGWRGKNVPSPDTAPIVAWLFKSFADGWAPPRLANDLNQRGVKAPEGGLWGSPSIKKMLSNPVYVGEIQWGKTRSGKFHRVGDGGEIERANPDNFRASGQPALVVPDAHEPLVSRALFEEVQARLAELKASQRKPRTKTRYVLSGLLYCGHCGAPMYGHYRHDSKHFHYVCGNRRQCNHFAVRCEIIERHVIQVVTDNITSHAAEERLRQRIVHAARELRSRSTDQRTLRHEIANLEKQIKRGTENLLKADADSFSLAQQMLTDWRSRLESLRAELEFSEADQKSAEKLAAGAFQCLAKWREGLSDPETLRDTLRQAIASITLVFDSKSHGCKGRQAVRCLIKRHAIDTETRLGADCQTLCETFESVPPSVDLTTSRRLVLQALAQCANGKPATAVAVGAVTGMTCKRVREHLRLAVKAGHAVKVAGGWRPAPALITPL